MIDPCPFCGQTRGVIWVRAHYQCAACGQVVVACCNGETASSCPAESTATAISRSDPRSIEDGDTVREGV